MSDKAKFSRRKFMQVTVIAGAAGPMVGCFGSISPWRCLSVEEARTLEAICERIIPTDQDPGAAWAGVVTFIDRQLVGPYRKFRKAYQRGIAGTNTAGMMMFGKPFVSLSARQQDAVLQSMDEGRAPGDGGKQPSAKSFFEMVANHTMQGYYGDPRHGGNRDRVSWKMLGLPYPPIRGRQ